MKHFLIVLMKWLEKDFPKHAVSLENFYNLDEFSRNEEIIDAAILTADQSVIDERVQKFFSDCNFSESPEEAMYKKGYDSFYGVKKFSFPGEISGEKIYKYRGFPTNNKVIPKNWTVILK